MTPGQRGEAIRDLQRRLGAAGFPPAAGCEAGCFCAHTQAAVRAFQETRGLRPDGVCDDATWTALVEASWRLGERQLFLTLPNQRGEDVADLQSRLLRLGFDCGRVDGILGLRTAQALTDFQSNCGIVADGMCAADTIRALERVSGHTGDGPGVSTVRERERMRSGLGSVAHCRIVVGQYGGLSALTRTLARELRQHGATVMALDEPDPVAQALAANHFAADVYIGVESRAEPAAVAHYYKVPNFESVGGRALAEAIAEELGGVITLTPAGTHVVGVRLPVLRETRMPAVVLAVGPARTAADEVPQLAAALLRAVQLWISSAE